jgi:hypothetical protein
MNIIIKNILIFLIVFILVMWLQHNDDNKLEIIKKRESLYDKVKLPLVSALLVILIKDIEYKECVDLYNSVINNKSSSQISSSQPFLTTQTSVESPILQSPQFQDISNVNYTNTLNDIYIEPPNF